LRIICRSADVWPTALFFRRIFRQTIFK